MADPGAVAEAEFLAEQPFNASDAKQVNAARKKAARLDRERLTVVKALMGNQATRLYLWDIMESCYCFTDPDVPGDTHATYKNLGRQSVGKQILLDTLNFPDHYMLMVQESKSRK